MQQATNEILVQLLEENNFNHGKLYRLKQSWLLRLKLSNQIIHKNVRVFCNLPKNDADPFFRTVFHEYEWKREANSLKNDDFANYVDINCNRCGSFSYYFTYDNDEKKELSKGGSNFLVDPKLILADGREIGLNSVQMQTVLAKLLGPLDEWKVRLQVAKESGYNMIHFTPVQYISKISNSSYCIRDHLKLIDRASRQDKYTLNDLEPVIQSIYKDWNMFSICDLVYNHIANESEFLLKCPQATYNLSNSPHLIPAYVLDRIFYHASVDISNGVYETQGISRLEFRDHNIETLRHILRHQEIPKYKLEEYFVIDVNKVLQKIKEIGLSELENIEKNLEKYKGKNTFTHQHKEDEWRKLKIIQDTKYRRLNSSIDFDIVKSILKIEFGGLNLSSDLKNSNENSQLLINIYERFQNELHRQNDGIRNLISNYLNEAVNNVISNTCYHFFAHDGPKWTKVNKTHPIVRNYFYFPFSDVNPKADELLAFDKEKSLRIQAHNGWVMGDDPLRNFAGEDSTVYFRRQLIPWGDSVKLRYGKKPEDNPELWEFMAEYTRITAKIFHGVRLDNCHSTPLHVAQYYLDIARSVKPNLYVIAELFTNSEDLDNKFVTELGITSLIREAMNAWNANELGRLVHRFGGKPVGSFHQHDCRPLLGDTAHAAFYDVTHDNKSLIKTRSVYDAMPTSSLVLMSGCATGSTRGFDELVPDEINVVHEERPYSIWDQSKSVKNSVNLDSGILRAKRAMNNLHFEMGENGYSEIYVDQFDNDTTVITRHNPKVHESIILIARTSFSHPSYHTHNNLSKPLLIPSQVHSVLFEANLSENKVIEFIDDTSFINGLQNYKLVFNDKIGANINKSSFIDNIFYDGSISYVNFKAFPPGTIMAFKVVLNQNSLDSLPYIRKSISELTSLSASNEPNQIDNIFNSLTFDELNILLFRCSAEESSEQIGSNVYDIPGYGPLVYSGLQGFINVLEKQRLINNLGHPFFENIRKGSWLMDYAADRLRKYYELQPAKRGNLFALSTWMKKVFNALNNMPRHLLPYYFDLIITGLYSKALQRCWTLMHKEKEKFSILNGSSFVRALAFAGISLTGNLRDSQIPNTVINQNERTSNLMLSLSAGLPFFSTSYMRNWGRDTFISIRGLLLLANRPDDTKNLILSYGSCLRHGLIPNLLGEGKFSRYNARDAVWWWLKAIRDYCELYGMDLLNENLFRLYPTDDAEYPSEEEFKNKEKSSRNQKLYDVIQEALTVHLRGLKFRERNAGQSIDEHMRSEGFDNEIGVDLETGFVFGGNEFNCGTWMDKMGSSANAGNKGIPGTPRDGSAVELVGLSRCILDFLIKANTQSKYPYDGAILNQSTGKKITWTEWAKKIDDNFEKYFWVDENSTESNLINKRNIYKDTLNSKIKWADYQLKPNFLIALVLAPQMIKKEHARKALKQVKVNLFQPNSIGIKTLDPSDYNYRGDYDNANDSNDRSVSHGFNYHQGPEWLWPVGYFLRALLFYSKDDQAQYAEELKYVKKHLGKLNDTINSNDWKSLPELTNSNGAECYFSCSSQAWSLATILEVLNDLAS